MANELTALETPALLLDEARMRANIARLRDRLPPPGPFLRPHVKTAKCLEVALAMSGGVPGPITVSTLREADRFAQAGFRDIVYAVGISPNKLPHAMALLASGVQLSVILDSVEAASALTAFMQGRPERLDVLIEIDTDGHRGGIAPAAPELLAVADALRSPSVRLQGVLTHAGVLALLGAARGAARGEGRACLRVLNKCRAAPAAAQERRADLCREEAHTARAAGGVRCWRR